MKSETQFFLDNLREAEKLLAATPAETIDLADYVQQTPCGTLMCFAGLLTTSEHFQKLGMTLDPAGGLRNGVLALEDIFGPNSFSNLFASYGRGYFDSDWVSMDDADEWGDPAPSKGVSDKELALYRCQRHRDYLLNKEQERNGT
jgi:hypothetical protein